MTRADLHVHSKHSNRPTEWLLRQAGAPESFSEPRAIHRRCRERGMDFVTISDHDAIAGALEIAHLPGTFLSEEITAAFPEDGCHVHCLAIGISEAQHGEIQRRRGDIYALRDYLVAEGIVHSVAHPLVRVNGRLTLAHLEKLLVLFDRFEGLNGIHDRRANELLQAIVGGLTDEIVGDLAERHRLIPQSPRPWEKCLTGGSDDHGGLFIATTWTATPAAATVEGFLAQLRRGASTPGGATGSTLRLTQSLYAIAYEFYRRRFLPFLGGRRDPFARLLAALAKPPEEPRRRFATMGGLGGLLRASSPRGGRRSSSALAVEEAGFACANRATARALEDLAAAFVRELRRGRLAGCLGAAAVQAAPLALTSAPFLVALNAQHRDRDLLDAAAARFPGCAAVAAGCGAAAWFADPLADGPAARTRALAARLAFGCGAGGGVGGLGGLVAIRCGGAAAGPGLDGVVFPPLFTLPLGADLPRLAVPPLLPVIDHCERARYAQIVVSAPGPLGLAGLLAAKLLGLRLLGVYPHGLLRRIAAAAASDAVAASARAYVRWFYGQLDGVAAADAAGRERLLALGLDPARVAVVGPAARAAAKVFATAGPFALQSVA